MVLVMVVVVVSGLEGANKRGANGESGTEKCTVTRHKLRVQCERKSTVQIEAMRRSIKECILKAKKNSGDNKQ